MIVAVGNGLTVTVVIEEVALQPFTVTRTRYAPLLVTFKLALVAPEISEPSLLHW